MSRLTDDQTRAVAQAIADELMRQEGSIDPPYPALPDDMELDYIDQGRADMGAVARAAIAAAFDEDNLTEIITDSIDLDWTPRTAARAIERERSNSVGDAARQATAALIAASPYTKEPSDG